MNQIKPKFHDAIIEDEYMWFFDNAIQAVCKMNLKTYIMEIVCKTMSKKNYYVHKMFSFQGKFYFVTLNAVGVLVYDKRRRLFDDFFVNEENTSKGIRLSGAFIYSRQIWLLPQRYNEEVFCFDIKRDQLINKGNIFKDITQKSRSGVLSPYFCQNDRELLLPIYGENGYARYDLINGCIQINMINESNTAISGIFKFKEKIFFTDIYNKSIMFLDEKGCVHKLREAEKANRPYSNIISVKDKLIVLPRFCDEIIVGFQDEFQQLDINFSRGESLSPLEMIRNIQETQNGVYLLPFQGEQMFFFDFDNMKISEIRIYTEVDYRFEKVDRNLSAQGKFKEKKDISLDSFIYYICKKMI